MKIKRMRFMTRREWVKKNRPECIGKFYIGGVQFCPAVYDFTDSCSYKDCSSFEFEGEKEARERCEKCWSKPAIIDGKYILVRKED